MWFRNPLSLFSWFLVLTGVSASLRGDYLRSISRDDKALRTPRRGLMQQQQTNPPPPVVPVPSPTAYPTASPVNAAAAPVDYAAGLDSVLQACLAAANGKVYATNSYQDVAFQYEVVLTNGTDPVATNDYVALKVQGYLTSKLITANCASGRRAAAAANSTGETSIRGVEISQGAVLDIPCQKLVAGEGQVCQPMQLTARVYLDESVKVDAYQIEIVALTTTSEAFSTGNVPVSSDPGLVNVAYRDGVNTLPPSNGASSVVSGDTSTNSSSGNDSMKPVGIFFLVVALVGFVGAVGFLVIRRRRRRHSAMDKAVVVNEETLNDDDVSYVGVEVDSDPPQQDKHLAYVVSDETDDTTEMILANLNSSSYQSNIDDEPTFVVLDKPSPDKELTRVVSDDMEGNTETILRDLHTPSFQTSFDDDPAFEVENKKFKETSDDPSYIFEEQSLRSDRIYRNSSRQSVADTIDF
jgi:hypothetical protein